MVFPWLFYDFLSAKFSLQYFPRSLSFEFRQYWGIGNVWRQEIHGHISHPKLFSLSIYKAVGLPYLICITPEVHRYGILKTELKKVRCDSFHNYNGMQWFTACACATSLIKCMWPFKLDCLLSPLIHSNCIINGVCIHSFIQWCIQNVLLPRYDNRDISLKTRFILWHRWN